MIIDKVKCNMDCFNCPYSDCIKETDEITFRYTHSTKFKQTRERYKQTDSYKESQVKYNKSDKRKEAVKRYNQSEKGRQSRAKYKQKIKQLKLQEV